MSSKLKKDAYFIGMWKDDVVTDNIIQEVASRSTMEKGRKVKLRLTPEGLLIAKRSIFQSSAKIDSIPITSIYFMIVNKHNPNCLLCIIRDTVRKYNVLAFRCVSALDAGEIVNTFKSIRGDHMTMIKKDDGNWTLRAHGSKYTHRQMLDVVRSKPSNVVQPNGDAHHEYVPADAVIHPSTDETEAVTKGEELVMKGKLLQNIGVQTYLHDDGDTMSEISDVSSFKEELDYLSQELREVKYLLEKSTGISAEEHLRMAKEVNHMNNNNNSLVFDKTHHGQAIRYSENNNDLVYTDKEGIAHAIVPDYRSRGVQTIPKSRSGRHHYNNASTAAVAAALRHDGRYVKVNNQSRIVNNTSNGQELRTSINGRVVSVPATQPIHVQTGSTRVVQTNQEVNGRDILKLRFDRPPAPLPTDDKSKSMRMRSQTSVPTSVERPIEYTYSTRMRDQYVIGQPMVSRKVRPRSMYIISGSRPLSVHNSTQHQKLVATHFEAPI